ncbi:MAG TPA: TetR/AcrR family transcriptional regulator [Bacillota bacterium]|nr:TetR/AcrR family transcriptional regulator [Bacillota bacterium]
MSRGFSEREKAWITDSLIEQGRILFRQLGFQKTSIADITKKVGIAQGTFYKFFRSKEELYFAILEKEEETIKKQWAEIDIITDNQPKNTIKQILKSMLDTVETNPLLRDLYLGKHLPHMVHQLPPKRLKRHFSHDSTSLQSLIGKWKQAGIILDDKPEIIAGILRSLFLVTLHKQEVGEAVYKETMERLIDLIVDGLVKVEG